MDSVQPILYQNKDRTIFLIDVPASLAAAQAPGEPLRIRLWSTEPLKQPHHAHNEPPASKRATIERNTVNTHLHEIYKPLLTQALDEIKTHLADRDWCLPRSIARADHSPGKNGWEVESFLHSTGDQVSRRFPLDPVAKERSDNSQDSAIPLMHDTGNTTCSATYSIKSILAHGLILGADEDDPECPQTIWQSSYVNRSNTIHILSIQQNTSPGLPVVRQFLVPPRSAFLLCDCADSAAFRALVRSGDAGDAQSRRFDFILLDPPFPNASAKRKRAYRRATTLRDISRLIESMDLDLHIAPNGYVGIWVTNKPAIRALVLDPGGIFDSLNVGLVEEWVWVKTTVSGEPVSDLNSVWRKPYEVLLLGRAPPSSLVVAQHSEHVTRRVIAGVPDLHSRKPCLKQLVESLLMGSRSYRALEIFARNLIAGWWCWGDEVLKFNWLGAYTEL